MKIETREDFETLAPAYVLYLFENTSFCRSSPSSNPKELKFSCETFDEGWSLHYKPILGNTSNYHHFDYAQNLEKLYKILFGRKEFLPFTQNSEMNWAGFWLRELVSLLCEKIEEYEGMK